MRYRKFQLDFRPLRRVILGPACRKLLHSRGQDLGNAFEVVNQVKIRGLANGIAKSVEDGLEFVRMRMQWKKVIGWERTSTDRSHTRYRLQFARVGYGFSRAEQATPESRPRASSFAGGGRGAVWVNLFFFL